jgi:formylglycine-generating enzyme required for sulfatase activity
LITNADFAVFVLEGGYETPVYWPTDVPAPGQPPDLTGDPQEPRKYISWYEADAFCHWQNSRLQTVADWQELLSEGRVDTVGNLLEWTGDRNDAGLYAVVGGGAETEQYLDPHVTYLGIGFRCVR